MPLITKNIVVGVSKTPTITTKPPEKQTAHKEELPPRLQIFGNFVNKSIPEPTPEPVRVVAPPVIVKKAVVVEEEAPVVSHYVKREDGELVRHLNKKSDYLRDVLELDS